MVTTKDSSITVLSIGIDQSILIGSELKIKTGTSETHDLYSLSEPLSGSDCVVLIQAPRGVEVSLEIHKRSFRVIFMRNGTCSDIFIPKHLLHFLDKTIEQKLKAKDKILQYASLCVRMENNGGLNVPVIFYNPNESGDLRFLTTPTQQSELKKFLERGKAFDIARSLTKIVLEAYSISRTKNKQKQPLE